MKNKLFVMMAIFLMFACLYGSVNAHAETFDDYVYHINDNNEVIIDKCWKSDPDIEIPAYIGEYPVSEIGNSAFWSRYVETVVIPEGIVSIGANAFKDCSVLKSITIPTTLEYVGYEAFWGCESLERVDISDLDAWLNIRMMSSPLQYAKKLYLNGNLVTDVVVSDEHRFVYENAFEGCQTIESVVLSDSVVDVGNYSFYNCQNLEYVILGDNTNTIGNLAFAYCNKLSSITIPVAMKYINYGAFDGCQSLEHIYYKGTEEQWKQIYVDDGNGILSKATIHYNYKDFDDSITYGIIDGKAYVKRLDTAYEGSVVIPAEYEGCPVEIVASGAFYDCDKITDVTFSNSVKEIRDHAFYNCTLLKSVNVPESVMTIGESAFGYCNALERVDITDIDKWCNIDFKDIYSNPLSFAEILYLNNEPVCEVVFPNGLTQVKYGTFYNCQSLESVIIPEGITSIGKNAFGNCKNLENVKMPDSLVSIDADAFSMCTSLKTLELPCNIETLGYGAFVSCTGVESIMIHNKLSNVSDYVFSGWVSLDLVEFRGTREEWKKIVFGTNNECLLNANICFVGDGVYVPVTSISLNHKFCVAMPGESFELSVELFPSDASDTGIIWSSSDESVAKVSNGIVTGVKTGICNIKAVSRSGHLVAVCRVKIVSPDVIPEKAAAGALFAENYLFKDKTVSFDLVLLTEEKICGAVFVAVYENKKFSHIKEYLAKEEIAVCVDYEYGQEMKVIWLNESNSPMSLPLRME